MELVIVERSYDQPFSDELGESMTRRFGPCFSLRRIKRLHSYISKDRLRTVCVYEAPDASSVRDVHDREGIPYVRIWSADMLNISSPSQALDRDDGMLDADSARADDDITRR
jgi:hypothetical protein